MSHKIDIIFLSKQKPKKAAILCQQKKKVFRERKTSSF